MKEFVPKRNDSLDVIRIAAVFAVVMTHCTAPFVTNFQPDTAEFLWGNLLDSISRAGVPLFLMISGALFLDERRETNRNYLLSGLSKEMTDMVEDVRLGKKVFK